MELTGHDPLQYKTGGGGVEWPCVRDRTREGEGVQRFLVDRAERSLGFPVGTGAKT